MTTASQQFVYNAWDAIIDLNGRRFTELEAYSIGLILAREYPDYLKQREANHEGNN